MVKHIITCLSIIIISAVRLAAQDLDEPVNFSNEHVKNSFGKEFILWLPCDTTTIKAHLFGPGKHKKLNYDLATPVAQTGSGFGMNTFYKIVISPSQQYALDFPSGTRLKAYSSSEVTFGYIDRRWKNFKVVGEVFIQQGKLDNHIEITTGDTKIYTSYANLRISNYTDDPFRRIALEKGVVLIKHDTSLVRLDKPGTELWIKKSTGEMWVEDIPVHGIRDLIWENDYEKSITSDEKYITQKIRNWHNNIAEYTQEDPYQVDTLFRKISYGEKAKLLSFIMQKQVTFDPDSQIAGDKSIRFAVNDDISEKTATLQKTVTDFILYNSSHMFDSLLLDYKNPFKKGEINSARLFLKDIIKPDQYKNLAEPLSAQDKVDLLKVLLPWYCETKIDTTEQEITYDIWIPEKMFSARKLKEFANNYTFLTYLWILRQEVERANWLTIIKFHSKKEKILFSNAPVSCCFIDYDKSNDEIMFMF
jgi:hypothetical protein